MMDLPEDQEIIDEEDDEWTDWLTDCKKSHRQKQDQIFIIITI